MHGWDYPKDSHLVFGVFFLGPAIHKRNVMCRNHKPGPSSGPAQGQNRTGGDGDESSWAAPCLDF